MPISTAKKLTNNESAIGEFWITKIAEWTKRKERAVVPVSAAKLLFSTGFRLIFFFFAVLGLAASLAVKTGQVEGNKIGSLQISGQMQVMAITKLVVESTEQSAGEVAKLECKGERQMAAD